MDPRVAQVLWAEQVRQAGFPVGAPEASPNALAAELDGALIAPAEWLDAVAVYVVDDELVLVGMLEDGPWAVVAPLQYLH